MTGDAALRPVLEPLVGRLDRTLVALDFDGVLAPIVARPDDAVALPGTADLLTALAVQGVAVAVVTGRPPLDAVRLGSLRDVPNLVVLGHYGLQRWTAGRLDTPVEHEGVAPARTRLIALARSRLGVTVEDKGHSVAIHTRQAPDPARVLTELRPSVDAIATATGLQTTPGRFVLELRPPGVDKGTALRVLVSETGAGAVVYVGDDIGDLPAVTTVRELVTEGLTGVVVCSDSEESPAALRDAADLVVPGPPGVQAVLRALVALAPEQRS